MILNPHMLPKVRSEALRRACRDMPCHARLGTFAGIQCAPDDTVVGCHIETTIGKGTGTKVSDLLIFAGCSVCHALYDGHDPRGMVLAQKYPAAWHIQIMRAHHATLAYWVQMGLITGVDWEII